MKTRKTQFLFIALFSFILFAGNVSAEGTERRTASSLEIDIEPALEIEAWMLNEDNINTGFTVSQEVEDALKIECWMISDVDTSVEEINLTKETEKSLKIESWMLDTKI